MEKITTHWKFQSLVGLKINWNIGALGAIGFSFVFQSLVGLKINWNIRDLVDSKLVPSFNP